MHAGEKLLLKVNPMIEGLIYSLKGNIEVDEFRNRLALLDHSAPEIIIDLLN